MMLEAKETAEIERALAHIRKLLEEQCARAIRLRDATAAREAGRKAIVIGILDGDGIGPVIMREARRLLQTLLREEIAKGAIVLREIEGLTIENREKTGESVPAKVLRAILECDVLLKGPTTTPKGGSLESANVTLRRELDLFANVRPVQVASEGIDWIFFRENTEGEYTLGSKGVTLDLEGTRLSMDFKVTTEHGTRRIAKAAFDYAVKNGKKKVAIVTKANIMKKTDGEFSRICNEVAKEYPGIETEDWYIDIMAANLVNPEIRSDFEVFLLPNLYGDIITDEAAQVQGGVGTAGSANIGEKCAMFEAVHGSAPRMVEAGLAEYANPASIFQAAELLLTHIGCKEKAQALRSALKYCVEEEKRVVVTGTADGATAREFTEYLMGRMNLL